MDDTWASRDLPVLDAAVRLLEDDSEVKVADIAAQTGLDGGTVAASLDALEGEYVVEVHRTMGDPSVWTITRITATARRAVGEWPTPESLVDQLAAASAVAAVKEPDSEKKGRLRQVAGFLGSAGRDVATDVVSKVIGHALGVQMAGRYSGTASSHIPNIAARSTRGQEGRDDLYKSPS
jgi:hypothetical protein